MLAQRAASEGPRWTRAVESIPVAPTYGPLTQPDHPYGGILIKSGKAERTPIQPCRTTFLNILKEKNHAILFFTSPP